MSKLRTSAAWIFGLILIVSTLAGANRLLQNVNAQPSPGAAPQPQPATSSGLDGLVARGTVYSDPPLFPVMLPSHLPAGSVVEVLVRSGQQVTAGEPLIRFDSSLLEQELAEAEAAYKAATEDYRLANNRLKDHEFTLVTARLNVDDAKLVHERAREAYLLTRKELTDYYSIAKDKDGISYTPQRIDEMLAKDSRLVPLRTAMDRAEIAIKQAENTLMQATAATDSLKGAVNAAVHKSEIIMSKRERAIKSIADCTVTARQPGTVEQVSASVGQTVYPQSRPLFYFVPAGPRLVQAEIVPDFAHRLRDRVGQKVRISDDTNTNIEYEGIVRRVPSAFLPKPNSLPDPISGKANMVLVVEIEVTNAAPDNLPPLRVGQPVRVIFP